MYPLMRSFQISGIHLGLKIIAKKDQYWSQNYHYKLKNNFHQFLFCIDLQPSYLFIIICLKWRKNTLQISNLLRLANREFHNWLCFDWSQNQPFAKISWAIHSFEFPPRLSANHVRVLAALANRSIGWQNLLRFSWQYKESLKKQDKCIDVFCQKSKFMHMSKPCFWPKWSTSMRMQVFIINPCPQPRIKKKISQSFFVLSQFLKYSFASQCLASSKSF